MRKLAITLLLLGSAGSAVLIALASIGGLFSARLDVISHFTPLLLLGVAAAAAVPVFRTGRMEGLAAAGILLMGLGCAAWAIVPAIVYRSVTADRADRASELKIIQFNALDGNSKGRAVRDWLKAQDPDIIVMEEGPQVAKYLSDLGYVATCGNCPAVILSRRPPYWSNEPTWDWMVGRQLAAARFRDHLGDYAVVGVHRGRPTRYARNVSERSALLTQARRFSRDSLILAGDFNAAPWSNSLKREEAALGLVRRTRALPTWPAEAVSHNRLGLPFPVLPIDHVYAGRDWATVKVERGPKLGSDHYPVVVTLQRVRNLPPHSPPIRTQGF